MRRCAQHGNHLFQKFAESAPEDVVEETKTNLVAREEDIAAIKAALTRLQELG